MYFHLILLGILSRLEKDVPNFPFLTDSPPPPPAALSQNMLSMTKKFFVDAPLITNVAQNLAKSD